jgi:hypothetical protein
MPRIFHNPAVQADVAPNANSEVDTASPKTAESVSASIGQVFTKLFATVVCEQAWQYMNSYPGNDASGSNTLYHRRFGRLSQRIIEHEHSLEAYSKVLCYRLSMIKLATLWKNFLGLLIVDAHLFDVCTWKEKRSQGIHPKDIRMANSNKQCTRYRNIYHMVFDAKIFDPPVEYFYTKPLEYLAIAFYESGWSMEQIGCDIEKLVFLSVKRHQRRAGLSESE